MNKIEALVRYDNAGDDSLSEEVPILSLNHCSSNDTLKNERLKICTSAGAKDVSWKDKPGTLEVGALSKHQDCLDDDLSLASKNIDDRNLQRIFFLEKGPFSGSNSKSDNTTFELHVTEIGALILSFYGRALLLYLNKEHSSAKRMRCLVFIKVAKEEDIDIVSTGGCPFSQIIENAMESNFQG